MKKFAKMISLAFFLVTTMLLCISPMAAAYFDPGTGSMILQIIGFMLIAFGGIWAGFKNRIKKLFGIKTEEPAEDVDDFDDDSIDFDDLDDVEGLEDLEDFEDLEDTEDPAEQAAADSAGSADAKDDNTAN